MAGRRVRRLPLCTWNSSGFTAPCTTVSPQPETRGDEDHVTEARLGVQGEHHPGGAQVGPGHALDAGGERHIVVIEPLVHAVGDGAVVVERGEDQADMAQYLRCPPWRAKRRRVVPGSREATRDTRRAEGAKGDPKGASERGVQSYGRPVCSRNELAMLWRNAG